MSTDKRPRPASLVGLLLSFFVYTTTDIVAENQKDQNHITYDYTLASSIIHLCSLFDFPHTKARSKTIARV